MMNTVDFTFAGPALETAFRENLLPPKSGDSALTHLTVSSEILETKL